MTGAVEQYALALYSLVEETGDEATVLQQMQAMRELFAGNPDFVKTVDAPSLTKEERAQLIENVFSGNVHAHLLSVLKIMAEKRWIYAFTHCESAFSQHYNALHEVLPAVAVTAVPMKEDALARLQAKLAKNTGETVELTNRVDPAIIGGVRIEMDTASIDGSISGKFKRMREAVEGSVL